jgi:hypothetical protein
MVAKGIEQRRDFLRVEGGKHNHQTFSKQGKGWTVMV